MRMIKAKTAELMISDFCCFQKYVHDTDARRSEDLSYFRLHTTLKLKATNTSSCVMFDILLLF